MRRTLLIAFASTLVGAVLFLASARPANATEVGYGRKLGLGFVLGDPTGFSGKYWVGPTNSLDFGLGLWGYGFDNCAGGGPCRHYVANAGSFNIDYLWQSNIVRGQAQLDWHIGPGGRAIFYGGCNGDCVQLAARMPVGLDLMFANPSWIEVFFEIAPALYFVPNIFDFGVEGGVGVRFYP